MITIICVFSFCLVLTFVVHTVAIENCPSPNSFGLSFSNWNKQKQAVPFTFSAPSSDEEVVNFLRETKQEKVQIVGSGMSFSGVQLSDDSHMLSLHNMNKLIHIKRINDDSGDSLVEVQAGIKVRDLCEKLNDHGLAMINLGATANQTIVGAMSTGTHGTGMKLGSLGASVRGLRLITADGNIMNLTPNDGFSFQSSITGVGRLGVVTSVILHVVPQWKMKFNMYDMSLEKLMGNLPQLIKDHPRLQWSFKPYTDNTPNIGL